MSKADAPRSKKSAAGKNSAHDSAPQLNADGYLEQSARPIASLIVVLPMVLLYEVGTIRLAAETGIETRIRAFNLFRQFLGFFGATSSFIAPAAVIGLLIALQLFRRDSWAVRWTTPILMILESAMWVVPLVLLAQLAAQFISLAAPGPSTSQIVVLCLGAGVYEELVFRLLLVTAMHLLLVDVLRMERSPATLIVVVWSALTFSLYHYWWGGEPFQWRSFSFRTAAGVYFTALFLGRGFGITALTHTAYDLVAVLSFTRGDPSR